jgi:hypothetical protein
MIIWFIDNRVKGSVLANAQIVMNVTRPLCWYISGSRRLFEDGL